MRLRTMLSLQVPTLGFWGRQWGRCRKYGGECRKRPERAGTVETLRRPERPEKSERSAIRLYLGMA